MLAIGALTDDRTTVALGTAFVVSDSLALTDRHCVGQRGDLVRIAFALGESVEAAVLDLDEANDLALLCLDASLPQGRSPVTLGTDSAACPGRLFRVRGFPTDRAFANDPDVIDGHVVEPEATAFGGLPVLNLFSPQVAAAAQKDPHGFSGAPVLVRAKGGADFAVGIVRWAHVDAMSGQVKGGTILATPVTAAARRWQAIEQLVVNRDAGVRAPVLPADSEIRAFREQYLGTVRRRVPFGGRERELAELDRWLNNVAAPPYLLVTAEAGRGKSALLVQWTASLDVPAVFVPISIRYELSAEDIFLRALVARLARLHREPEPPRDPESLRAALHELLRRPAPDGRLIVALDGLDETEGWTISPSLLPRVPGTGIHIILSARLTAERPTARAYLSALGWERDDAATLSVGPLDEAGVEGVLRSSDGSVRELAESREAVRRLHRRSEGDPLVLSLFVRDLVGADASSLAAEVEALPERPAGLDDVFAQWWDDQRRVWDTTANGAKQVVWPVLDALACARGPLRRGDLLAVASEAVPLDDLRLGDALRALDRFLVRNEGGYSLSHPRLADHRRARLREDGLWRDREEAFARWGRRVLLSVREGALAPADAPPYIVRHLGEHLVELGAPLDALVELVDPAWRAAWDATVDTWNGYLVDVRRAADAARRAAETAIRTGTKSRGAVDCVRCAVVASSATDVELVMSGALALALVRHGVWSDRRALDAILAIDHEGDRVRGIASLAPVLTPVTLGRATETLAAVDPVGWRLPFGEALGTVAARWAAAVDSDAAVGVLAARPVGTVRASALLTLLREQPKTGAAGGLSLLVEDLVAIRDGLTIVEVADVLDRVATSVAPDALGSALEPEAGDAVTTAISFLTSCWDGGVDRPFNSTVTAARLAPWLREDDRRCALDDVLSNLEQGTWRDANPALIPIGIVSSLLNIAPLLEPDQAGRALALVSTIDNDAIKRPSQSTAYLLATLAERLPAADRDYPLSLIVTHLHDLVVAWSGDVSHHVNLIAACARAGLAETLVAAAEDAPETEARDWAEALRVIAPQLQPDLVTRALAIVDRLPPYYARSVLAPLLARLASRGPVEARDALARAQAPVERRERQAASALRVAATQSPPQFTTLPRPDPVNTDAATVAIARVMDHLTPSLGDGDEYVELEEIAEIAELLAMSDRAGVEQARQAVEQLSSQTDRDRLRNVVAQRLAQLGDVVASLEVASRIYEDRAVPSFRAALAYASDNDLDKWLLAVQTKFAADMSGDERLELASIAAVRLAGLDAPGAWAVLEAWLDREGTRAERLVDLCAYAPALVTVSGREVVLDLADWVENVPG